MPTNFLPSLLYIGLLVSVLFPHLPHSILPNLSLLPKDSLAPSPLLPTQQVQVGFKISWYAIPGVGVASWREIKRSGTPMSSVVANKSSHQVSVMYRKKYILTPSGLRKF